MSFLHHLAGASPGTASSGVEERKGEPKDYWPAWGEEVVRLVRAWLSRAVPLVDSLNQQKSLEEQQLWEEAAMARKKKKSERELNSTQKSVEKNTQQHNPGLMGEHRVMTDGKPQVYGSDSRNSDGSKGFPCQSATMSPASMYQPLQASSADDLGRVVSVLCLLGGQFESLHPGAKVLCHMTPGFDIACERSGLHTGAQETRGDWKNGAVEEATVLRLGPLRARNRGARSPPSTERVTRENTVEGAMRDLVRETIQEPRPVFASRVVPPELRTVRPLDMYDSFSQDGSLSAAAVAREIARDNQIRLQQQQNISPYLATARLGAVFRGQGREWAGLRRLSSPDNGVSVDLPLNAARRAAATTDSPDGERIVTASSQRQESASGCGEWVTVGSLREGHGGVHRAATVPTNSVTPISTGLPRALESALMPHVKEFMPGLKALLGADTAFQGA